MIYDWIAIVIVFVILGLMFLAIGDIIDRCVTYWREYRDVDSS